MNIFHTDTFYIKNKLQITKLTVMAKLFFVFLPSARENYQYRATQRGIVRLIPIILQMRRDSYSKKKYTYVARDNGVMRAANSRIIISKLNSDHIVARSSQRELHKSCLETKVQSVLFVSSTV